MKKMFDKVVEYWVIILSAIGAFTIIHLLRKSSEVDDIITDVSENLKKREEILENIKNIDTSKMTDEEITEWLKKL